MEICPGVGYGGDDSCARHCPWLLRTDRVRLQLELCEAEAMQPEDVIGGGDETATVEQRAAERPLDYMGVRSPEVEDAAFMARVSGCDGPVTERKYRIPIWGKRFGPMIVRCANAAIPWRHFPLTRYPGRKALIGKAPRL